MTGFFVIRNESPGREGYFQRRPSAGEQRKPFTEWGITERLEDAEPFHSMSDLLWEVQGIGQQNPTWRFTMKLIRVDPW